MDKVIQVLFNTNHEMPGFYVMLALFALCLIVPAIARYVQQRRGWEHMPPEPPRDETPPASPDPDKAPPASQQKQKGNAKKFKKSKKPKKKKR